MRRIPLSVVTKPTGAACNLDCKYCFFLSKQLLYDEKRQLMSRDTLEAYVRNFLAASEDGEVTLLWQGGEPTMRGVDFYRDAVAFAKRYRRPGQRVRHGLQTNATLIDDEWAAFFAENDFLVGVSIDGPARLHDTYRVNRAGRATHAQVIRGYEILRRHGVRTNILCTVNSANQDHGLEVYRYFRDELHASFMQFIPIVERFTEEELGAARDGWSSRSFLYTQSGDYVSERSVTPKKYGQFLIDVFDEWVSNDVGEVFVSDFDAALSAMFNIHPLCVHAPECGNNVAMEFNGDVYACDHWVEPDWLLGNVHVSDFPSLVETPTMQRFARKKNAELPVTCQQCPVRKFCHGGCPKDRCGDDGVNYLCEGFYSFYSHIRRDVLDMARLVTFGRPAAEIMSRGTRP